MKRAKAFILAAHILSSLPAAAQDTARIPADIGARVAEEYVIPSLAGFSSTAGELRNEMEALCADPGQAALEEARTAFAATIKAWGAVSVLRFGPLVEENRFEHLFFWPDVRGVTLRQVQGVLAQKDEQAALPDGLKQKSVAVQGLPALEFVLYGSGSEALASGDESYRCRYGAAITANVADRAGNIAAAWAPGAPFHTAFTQPAPDNAAYRSPDEVAGEVVKALGTALQFVRDAEILPALGDSIEKANGRRAPFRRSDLSFEFIGSQAEGVIGLLRAAGFETELDGNGRGIVNSLLFDLTHARDAIAAVNAPAETAFAAEEDRSRISYAAVALQGANRTLGEQLSAVIGLTMGFNALDGD
ncbi:imelysin family protein [Chelativorans sp. AA-79]|uniref:imelysin family protein n=1 Tax=Chelativorans sp. AA-79 TaxID=3028735 RepID=UPI0023F92FCB|nr:imelysin family protein [Chelativorans sp. AA-79]WEX08185.1 imelysin family protein [Chelativorans sp. AA-79]